MLPITATRNKAVRKATSRHRPDNQGNCHACQTQWTATHLANEISAAADGAAVEPHPQQQWEIHLDE